jgi:hypothetical protein
VGESPDHRDEILRLLGKAGPDIDRIPAFRERPRLSAQLREELLESDLSIDPDERVLLGDLALFEEVLHKAHEASKVLRDPRFRCELNRLVVAGVDEHAEPALEVQNRVERDDEDDVCDIRTSSPLALGIPPEGGMVEARIKEDRGGGPPALLRARPDGRMVLELHGHPLQFRVREDEG